MNDNQSGWDDPMATPLEDMAALKNYHRPGTFAEVYGKHLPLVSRRAGEQIVVVEVSQVELDRAAEWLLKAEEIE